jgi:predicted NBD/HSP70 family sugar kinase
VEDAILVELEPVGNEDQRRPGPRGTGLALNPELVSAVGVDFGFRHVRVLVCDLQANVLAIETAELPSTYSKTAGISAATSLVKAAVTASGVNPLTVLGAGVGLPGPIATDAQRVADSNVLPGWAGTRAQDFANAFGLPVLIENDSNLAALGEHVWGAGRDRDTTITVKFHSGIGVGVIVHDELVSGTHGGAGELGHVTVDPRGPICRCGKRGCLDTFAAVPAILEAVAIKRPVVEVAELIAMLGSEPSAERVVADAATLVGEVVGSASLLLAPDSIIVVGAMARAGEIVLGPLRAALERQTIPGMQSPEVVRGALDDRQTALGAATLVLRWGGWLAGQTRTGATQPATPAHTDASHFVRTVAPELLRTS